MADIVFIAALVVMLAGSLYFVGRVKAPMVAVQWGFDGKPTRYVPRRIALWGAMVFAVFVRGLIYAATIYTPDRVHGAEIGVMIFSVIIAGTHLWTLYAAARGR